VARTSPVRAAYESYRTDEAIRDIDRELKEGPQNDKLLALMDKGTILHAAGRFEVSIAVLREAD
jgi:hypothetical protein